jgi:hypothetical protein
MSQGLPARLIQVVAIRVPVGGAAIMGGGNFILFPVSQRISGSRNSSSR